MADIDTDQICFSVLFWVKSKFGYGQKLTHCNSGPVWPEDGVKITQFPPKLHKK